MSTIQIEFLLGCVASGYSVCLYAVELATHDAHANLMQRLHLLWRSRDWTYFHYGYQCCCKVMVKLLSLMVASRSRTFGGDSLKVLLEDIRVGNVSGED